MHNKNWWCTCIAQCKNPKLHRDITNAEKHLRKVYREKCGNLRERET